MYGSCCFLLFSSPFLSFSVCGWYIWLEWMGKLSAVLSQLGFMEAGWLYVERWEALLSKRDRFGAAFGKALGRCERLFCNCCNSLLWEQTATTKCSWVKFIWNSMEKLVMEELASSSTLSLLQAEQLLPHAFSWHSWRSHVYPRGCCRGYGRQVWD